MAELDSLRDGDRVRLWPNENNPIHKAPIFATYHGGYFYCDGTSPELGPDYYLGDVLLYNDHVVKEARDGSR